MIVRINDNDDYMEKLSAQPKFVNVTDKLGLENGKHVQDQTVRDTIRVKFLIEEYTEYNFQYHTVSNFINVVSNDIKQNISSIYVDSYTNKQNDMAHGLSIKLWTLLNSIEAKNWFQESIIKQPRVVLLFSKNIMK